MLPGSEEYLCGFGYGRKREADRRLPCVATALSEDRLRASLRAIGFRLYDRPALNAPGRHQAKSRVPLNPARRRFFGGTSRPGHAMC